MLKNTKPQNSIQKLSYSLPILLFAKMITNLLIVRLKYYAIAILIKYFHLYIVFALKHHREMPYTLIVDQQNLLIHMQQNLFLKPPILSASIIFYDAIYVIYLQKKAVSKICLVGMSVLNYFRSENII